MELLELTKIQMRYCLDYKEWAEDIAKRFNQQELKNRINWDKDIKEIDGKIYYVKTKGDTCYKYLMENHTVTKMLINNQEVTTPELERLLGDLTPEEQKHCLQNLYLESIENYLSKRTGTKIKLYSEVKLNKNDEWVLNLFTGNLIDKSGICVAMLKEIHIESNDIVYYINRQTGEQQLGIIRFNFRYTHQDGGFNGHEIGTVIWNEKDATFEGYNYETEKYEVI